MAQLNEHYLKLKAGYLFPEIGRRVKAFSDANSDAAKRLIRCGIGDVTEPLPPAVIAALHKAVEEMGQRDSFRGYGPEQGYEFLRTAIAQHDFRGHGLEVADDEVFVNDGEQVLTSLIFPKPESSGIEFFGPEKTRISSLEIWPLNRAW